MERTVKAHIEDLERIVRELNDDLMHEENVHVRNALESKIRAAELALQHHRSGRELEQDLGSPVTYGACDGEHQPSIKSAIGHSE